MILKKKIPRDFYKLFRTQNMDYYMQLLTALYQAMQEAYALTQLTDSECRSILAETIARVNMVWWDDETEKTEDEGFPGLSPSAVLDRLVKWGWLSSDFDEKLNCYIIGFPEYSRLYAELFDRLGKEDDSMERESILSVYSALYTYDADSEKNNSILKSAVRTSKSLGQMLSNMQDSMRLWFDELSKRRDFIGIQEVLVNEINNRESVKYAILTTTDSFYRYKEAVKAYCEGTFDEEKVAVWDERLRRVFNRGFWDGYYLGQRLGEWSSKYGSGATRKKVYVARGIKYFSGIGVAEFEMESGSLRVGDEILVTGPTTGAVMQTVDEIRVDLKPVEETVKGERFSIKMSEKIRPSDRLYKMEKVQIEKELQ